MLRRYRDWVRGGRGTPFPSEVNRQLYEGEAQPMFRRRVAGILNLAVVIVAAPLWIVVLGVKEFLPEAGFMVRDSIRMVRTGRWR